jgi:hypothetical protein
MPSNNVLEPSPYYEKVEELSKELEETRKIIRLLAFKPTKTYIIDLGDEIFYRNSFLSCVIIFFNYREAIIKDMITDKLNTTDFNTSAIIENESGSIYFKFYRSEYDRNYENISLVHTFYQFFLPIQVDTEKEKTTYKTKAELLKRKLLALRVVGLI